MASFIDDLSAYVLSLCLKDRQPFSSPFNWTILSNGGADYHDSIILFGFEGEKLIPSLVAKTPRLPENGWALQAEYDRLVDLWIFLGPEAALCLPQPIAMVTLRKQPVLIISYVHGESLLRMSKKVLWENPRRVLALAVDAARSLRDILDQTATSLAKGEQISSDFPQKVDKFKELYSLTESENRVIADLLERLETVRARASHKVLIQGDFWHGNMIREAHHGHLMFVDWQYSRWVTDVSLDVYLFLLAAALASVPKDSADEKVRGAVKILRNWQADIIPAYLAAFGKPTGYTLLPIKEGMLVCCIEKAVRASMDFGYHQADDQIWRFIFAEISSWQEESRSVHV
jgi:aminoglycoside phosphotransferase (APT) family kinase protein